MQKVLCLMGPTASGKTQLAVRLVQQFPLEIISVDSAMVYRGMDIGTAKPDETILKIAPHRLINFRDPSDPYSAAEFCEDAMREIADILSKKKIPLLVGGTMLYFRALQKGLSELPSSDPHIREKINKEAETIGLKELHDRLKIIDPESAARIHPHDSQRIQRALEVYEISGKTLSSFLKENRNYISRYDVHNFGIAPSDRAILHERIAARFHTMLQEGFLDEAKKLFGRGDLTLDTPAIRSVGYRQMWEYLQGNYSYDEMVKKSIVATRQLAKRQMTWLRSWPEIILFDSEDNYLFEKISVEIGRIAGF